MSDNDKMKKKQAALHERHETTKGPMYHVEEKLRKAKKSKDKVAAGLKNPTVGTIGIGARRADPDRPPQLSEEDYKNLK